MPQIDPSKPVAREPTFSSSPPELTIFKLEEQSQRKKALPAQLEARHKEEMQRLAYEQHQREQRRKWPS